MFPGVDPVALEEVFQANRWVPKYYSGFLCVLRWQRPNRPPRNFCKFFFRIGHKNRRYEKEHLKLNILFLKSQHHYANSPYWSPHIFLGTAWENSCLWINSLTLVTSICHDELMWWGEIWLWSLLGLKRFKRYILRRREDVDQRIWKCLQMLEFNWLLRYLLPSWMALNGLGFNKKCFNWLEICFENGRRKNGWIVLYPLNRCTVVLLIFFLTLRSVSEAFRTLVSCGTCPNSLFYGMCPSSPWCPVECTPISK